MEGSHSGYLHWKIVPFTKADTKIQTVNRRKGAYLPLFFGSFQFMDKFFMFPVKLLIFLFFKTFDILTMQADNAFTWLSAIRIEKKGGGI